MNMGGQVAGMGVASVFAFVLAACGAPVLPQSLPRPQSEPTDVLISLETVPERNERPVVVGVTGAPAQLFAAELNGKFLWMTPVDARSAPVVAGDVVVMQETNGVVARSLTDGRSLFRIDDGAQLVGADGADDLVVVSVLLEPDSDSRCLLVGARAGHVRWELEIEPLCGVPTLVGASVLAPWGTSRVSILNAATGEERGRVMLKDSVAGHAFVDRQAAYIGQHGLLKVDRKLASGMTAGATFYSPVARPMPGQPGLLRASYEPVPAPDNAGHRVNLNWRVKASGDGLSMEDSTLYLHFYKFVFALDADSDTVRWLYQGDADVVATAVQPGGIYLVDVEGKVLFLDSAGNVKWHAKLVDKPVVAQIRPGRLIPEATPSAPSSPPASSPDNAKAKEPPRSLREQLVGAARLDDPRLATARAFAVEHLSRFDDAVVTGQLSEICADARAPEPVTTLACRKLGQRLTGEREVLAAITASGTAPGVTPPALGPLADAARGMKLQAAAPLLLPHVDNPQADAEVLASIFAALGALGHRPSTGTIERFLKLYHAEPSEPGLAHALRAALEALAALRGNAALPTLQRIADDPMTMSGLGDATKQTIALIENPPAPAQAEKPKNESVEAPPKPEPTQPRSLTMAMVARVLDEAEPRLRRCLGNGPDEILSARVAMLVRGTGDIANVLVTPTTLEDCVAPIVREHHFPATQTALQQIVYPIESRTLEMQRKRAERKARRDAIQDDRAVRRAHLPAQ